MVADSPWLSALRGLAAEGVTLVFCQGLVGLPSWGCGASGFLGPTVFMVFAMRSPISGRDCVLPQSAIVTKTFPPSGGFGSWPSCGVPCLRLALCSLACISPGGYPSFSQVGPAPSHWIPLLWTWLVWEASTVSFSYVFFRDVVTLWVNSVFLSIVFFPVPCYGYMSASTTLASGLRLSLMPYPGSFRVGLEPLSEAPLCTRQPPAHSFLVVLAVAVCLRELLDLSIVLP